MDLSKRLHGSYVKSDYFSSGKVALIFEVPLRDAIAGFYDNLKSVTQGFSSMNYEILDYRKGDLVKMDILVSGRKEEALSKIVRREDAFEEGKKMVEKLKEVLPAQLYTRLPYRRRFREKLSQGKP
jgi:GTP-binding protein LepA